MAPSKHAKLPVVVAPAVTFWPPRVQPDALRWAWIGSSRATKVAVISRVLRQLGIRGDELIGFGDGVVETQAVKAAGGVAVGVASAAD